MIGLAKRRPGAPTVVFLHGAGLGSWTWRPTMEALPEFDAVALDLPGHGASAGQPWRSVPDASDRVAEWISHEATGGRAGVVGLSLGGVVTLDLAARHPAVVDRVVTTGALATGLTGARWLGWLMAASVPMARIPGLLGLSARMLGLDPADRIRLDEDIRRLTPGLVQDVLRDVAAYRITPALLASPAAALVVAGTREHGAIRRTVARLDAEWPSAVGRLVPGATHVWPLQRPEAFTTLVREWLADRRPASFLTPAR